MARTITIHENGAITALHSRKPDSLQIHKLGKASITRTTDIVFHQEKQLWYAEFLEGEFSGRRLTTDMCRMAEISPESLRLSKASMDESTLYFDTDTDCIHAEHLIVDGLRRNNFMLHAA
jgi:hypothetical protein